MLKFGEVCRQISIASLRLNRGETLLFLLLQFDNLLHLFVKGCCWEARGKLGDPFSKGFHLGAEGFYLFFDPSGLVSL